MINLDKPQINSDKSLINPRNKESKADRHLLREWTPYAMFREAWHSRQYCQDVADYDRKNQHRVVQRDGWYVVERKRDPYAD